MKEKKTERKKEVKLMQMCNDVKEHNVNDISNNTGER